MEATSPGTNRLHIGRFRSEYLVPAAHPNPRRVQDRLDATFAKRLPEVLQATLGRWFANSDDSVWLVRRLEVHIAVSTGWSHDQAARCLTRGVAKALAQAVQGSGEDVLCFPNRAAYLAQFLTDLATGHAWSAWYYETFRGLRMLPVSAALRTAICEDPHTGFSALLGLSGRAAAQVLATLTAQDARRILDHMPTGTTSEDAGVHFERVWMAWHELDMESSSIGQEPQEVLRLYLRACRRQPASSSPLLKAMARALVRLARRLAETPADERLLMALTAEDTAALYVVAGGGDAEVLHPLRQVAPEHVQAVGQALLARRTGPFTLEVQRSTAFGGLFLLLPLLDALPVDGATRDWPSLRETLAANLVRFLILIKCLSRPRASSAFSDPLLRDLMKVGPAVTWADVRGWLARRTRAQLGSFLATMAAWQKAQGAVTGTAVTLIGVPLPGAPAGVVLDRRRGIGLFATGYAPRHPHRLIEHVHAWLTQAGFAPEHVVSGMPFVEHVRGAYPEASIEEDAEASSVQAAGDLHVLVQPKALCSARTADLALSVAAHQVLRAFAWRLPGFAASSPPYLVANVLDIPATLNDEVERRVVRLGQPPLQYVLGLTGMARSTYRVNWLDERPFVLFQE